MSIYIKGLHLPRPSVDPRLPSPNRFVVVQIYDNGDAIIHGYGTFGGKYTHYEPDPLRDQKIFTAYELPPHGRLIDADALAESIKDSLDECHEWANQAVGTFAECALRVKNAPIIIPAEEG